MKRDRRTAIVIGMLFLAALILNLIASDICDPILKTTDYLDNAYPDKTQIVFGNLLKIICALSMIFIPIVFLPVGRRYNEHLAISYIVFRALEGIIFVFIVAKTLSLVSLSKAYISAGSTSFSIFKVLGDSVHAEVQWAIILDVIIFSLGAMTFYYLLYKTRLIPRFISVWGFLAAILLFIGTMLGIFGVGLFHSMPFMKGIVYFAPPIALNELVLGIWLIVKGFNASTMDSPTPRNA